MTGAGFEREYGCTEREWLRWLPGAAGAAQVQVTGDAACIAPVGQGTLQLDWHVLPPRRVALMAMPVLGVRFRFDGVADEARQAFMRYFDLFMQRGGG